MPGARVKQTATIKKGVVASAKKLAGRQAKALAGTRSRRSDSNYELELANRKKANKSCNLVKGKGAMTMKTRRGAK
jgi:hypothetical protein